MGNVRFLLTIMALLNALTNGQQNGTVLYNFINSYFEYSTYMHALVIYSII